MTVQEFIEGKETPLKPSDKLRIEIKNLEAALQAEIENAIETNEEGFEDGDTVLVETSLGDMKLIFTAYYYSMEEGGFVWVTHFDSLIIIDDLPRVMGTTNSEDFIASLLDIFRLDDLTPPDIEI